MFKTGKMVQQDHGIVQLWALSGYRNECSDLIELGERNYSICE
jgi:hypothetical protein